MGQTTGCLVGPLTLHKAGDYALGGLDSADNVGASGAQEETACSDLQSELLS